MRILLVEDETYLAEAIQHLLKRSGYDVDIADNGETGLQFARNGVYEAIILDNMLPKLSGIMVLRSLRSEHIATPVLMLSAKSETNDKVEGLEVGADDYLAKPFKTVELMARLQAITRRHGHSAKGGLLRYGDITLCDDDHSITSGKSKVNLTSKEYAMLHMLTAMGSDKIVSTQALYYRAWGSDSFVEPKYVSVYISYLRKKLTHLGSDVRIKASRGVGYQLQVGVKHV